MNLFKKWWFWFVLFIIVLILFRTSSGVLQLYIGDLLFKLFLFAPILFSLIGLIVNINKNKKMDESIFKDKFFWIWVALLILALSYLLFMLLFGLRHSGNFYQIVA